MKQLFRFPDIDRLSINAAQYIVDDILHKITVKKECSVFLGGGSTPQKCYQHIGALLFDTSVYPHLQSRIHWFMGDERYVPRDDRQRNEKMVIKYLFSQFKPYPSCIHFWEEPPLSAVQCAEQYDTFLSNFFRNQNPDIAILGLGSDGHTASLFPNSLVEQKDMNRIPLTPDIPGNALAIYIPEKQIYRLSVSPLFLQRMERTVFLATGIEKKEAFNRLMSKDLRVPSAWIANEKSTFFITDDIGK